MEMACCNMVEPDDRVLVATNGIWGDRFSEMVRRQGTSTPEDPLFLSCRVPVITCLLISSTLLCT